MTPSERKQLKRLDDLVLRASCLELKKIQAADYQTQMEGVPFYDIYLDSSSLVSKAVVRSAKKY